MPLSLFRTSTFTRRTLLVFFIAATVVLLVRQYNAIIRWRRIPSGFPENHQPFPKPQFRPGTPKPPGSSYSRTLVMPRMVEEDVSWVHEEFPDMQTAIYVVDDPESPLHPPKNKGHEVMVYLSYIIDHYDELPDIMLFMHSHRYAWHNEEPLDMDAIQLIHRVSNEHIMREGFMNLRCNWGPGCPDWIHPKATDEDFNKQEEPMVSRTWGELFPYEPVPEVLAQPCCAQFALSRDRVLTLPKSRYIYYRDWLLLTDLSDYISGRIWEYLWHVVFTGESVFCPMQHICYCDGYGLCFGGEEGYERYAGLYYEIRYLQMELQEWRDMAQAIQDAMDEGRVEDAERMEVPPQGKDAWLDNEINMKVSNLFAMKMEALARGENPENRAKEAGREWKEGDGF